MTAGIKKVGTLSGGASRPRPKSVATPGSRAARGDPRWPRIAVALAGLRERHRHAVRIVDADCGCGTLLIETVRYARTLGFIAVEGRGIDGVPAMIGRARAAATRLDDPAIGLVFDLADMIQALVQEADFPADIVLWHRARGKIDQPDVAAVLAAAGDLVVDDAEQRATGVQVS